MLNAGICGNAGPTWACHHPHLPPPTLTPLPLNSKQIPTTQGGAPNTSYKRQQTHPCTPDRGDGGGEITCSSEIQQRMFASMSAPPWTQFDFSHLLLKRPMVYLQLTKHYFFYKLDCTFRSGQWMTRQANRNLVEIAWYVISLDRLKSQWNGSSDLFSI